MKIAINIIATNKYIQFVQPLVDSIEKYFLVDHDITVNLFTDQDAVIYHNRTDIKIHKIPSYGFPDATLLRYHIMFGIDYDCDYIYYLDADMLINDFVGEEILGSLVAVRHPGYFIEPKSGSWETRIESEACVKPSERKKYYAGGFQGGRTGNYILAMEAIIIDIDIDTKRGVTAIWHDESHWNKLLVDFGSGIHELNPSYCMPQAWSKRVYSKIQHLPAKILALEKSNDIRQ
jgi:histo-blood group ABO system transferase